MYIYWTCISHIYIVSSTHINHPTSEKIYIWCDYSYIEVIYGLYTVTWNELAIKLFDMVTICTEVYDSYVFRSWAILRWLSCWIAKAVSYTKMNLNQAHDYHRMYTYHKFQFCLLILERNDNGLLDISQCPKTETICLPVSHRGFLNEADRLWVHQEPTQLSLAVIMSICYKWGNIARTWHKNSVFDGD